MARTCAACAETSDDTAQFCEACGHDLRTPVPTPAMAPAAPAVPAASAHPAAAHPAAAAAPAAAVHPAAAAWASSGARAGACAHCGTGAPAAGASALAVAYCGECGRRRGAGRDRAELELPGVAAATDRGSHRHHNEDAVAIGVAGAGAVAIVCDGVSSSPRADAAAVAACEAALPALVRALDRGDSAGDATRAAFDEAFLAVDALIEEVPTDAPSCTYVSGVVTADGVTVGWVGDSRAYWIPAAGPPRCLTVDDALPDTPGAPLIRWVGADAPDVVIQVVTLEPSVPGSLLLCTDGLSRYLSDSADLALVAGSPPAAAARRLVAYALAAGGADNVAVALLTGPVDTRGPVQGKEPDPQPGGDDA